MLIVGTGGLASDILSSMEFDDIDLNKIVFYNDTDIEPISYIKDNLKIINSLKEAEKYFGEEGNEFIVGIGDNKERERLTGLFESIGGVNINYISKKALVSKYVKLAEKGIIIMHQTVIGNACEIGKGSVIYVGSNLGHQSIIGRYTLISGQVCMSNCKVGNYCFLGIGTLVKPNVVIEDEVISGIGSIIIKNALKSTIVIGNPAKVRV